MRVIKSYQTIRVFLLGFFSFLILCCLSSFVFSDDFSIETSGSGQTDFSLINFISDLKTTDWLLGQGQRVQIETEPVSQNRVCVLSAASNRNAPTRFEYVMPDVFKQNIMDHSYLALEISSPANGSRLRIGIKEKSGEEWRSLASYPITQNPIKINCALDSGDFEQVSKAIKNRRVDLDQIQSVLLYVEPQNTALVTLTVHAVTFYSNIIYDLIQFGQKTKGLSAQSVTAKSRKKITLVAKSDMTNPEISYIKVDGKELIDGDYVQRLPVITAGLSDSGVQDSGVATWQIKIIEDESMIIQSHSGNGGLATNSIEASFTLTQPLTEGRYAVTVKVYDGAGGFAESQSPTFQVSESFKIREALNAPNPFNPHNQSTYIQYQLTSSAVVDLYIYTISGERIWYRRCESETEGGRAGFNSVEWNGVNDFHETVANGVYVVYIVAKADGKTASAKVKMMVLK